MWGAKLLVAVGAAAVVVVVLGTRTRQGTEPLVKTGIGTIRGLRADEKYSMFMGIPYAKINKDHPFTVAEPYPKFEETFNAFDDSARCPQREEFNNTLTGSLDCLHLNIYVPDVASAMNKVAVLVLIHGGAFSIGFASRYMYGPRFFIRHDIILVTFNYRVGPYGFMCLDTPEVPGNQGLKDQRLALRWVKANIEAFGGDASKITLMGESAGGSATGLQLMAKQERLFDQVIMQSGSALAPWAVHESDPEAPLKLAARLGYAAEKPGDALAFLAKANPSLVVSVANDFLGFVPCVEKEFEGIEGVVTEHPFVAEAPNIRGMKILVGFNNKEQVISYTQRQPSDFANLNVFRYIRGSFILDDEYQAMEDILRRFYIGDEEITEAQRWKLMEFEADWLFNYPAEWSVTNSLEKGADTVYYYVFSYSGGRNFAKDMHKVKADGAAHADELGYLFDMAYYTEPLSPKDWKIIDQMTTLWANFVKYGDPTPETTELLPVKWTPVTKDTYWCLELGSELTMKRRPYSDRLSFWQLFYKANWNRLRAISQ